MYYSQQSEDRILFEKYLNYPNGFFIELGAMDGVTYSNTLFFERHLNWTGILIEPTNQYNSLVLNRPNCFNFNFAVSKKDGEVEFVGNHALGGIRESMDDEHYYGWKMNEQSTYKVQSKPMYEIINEVKSKRIIEKIDLLSLDVEGGELEVLETYDWTIPTKFILIEMLNNNIEKEENCRKILRDNSFELIEKIGINELWRNSKFI